MVFQSSPNIFNWIQILDITIQHITWKIGNDSENDLQYPKFEEKTK